VYFCLNAFITIQYSVFRSALLYHLFRF